MDSSILGHAIKSKNLSPAKLALLKGAMPDEMAEVEADKIVNKVLNQFITVDPELVAVKDQVRILSETDDPVLIIGETGTGKELLATALHGDRTVRAKAQQSDGGSFITVNCAGIPEALVESELFGHTKGAFTGALTEKHGLLKAAWNGTIFLDEIGDLPLSAQAKLLRAIQEKSIRKVGAEQEEKINCRIVTATHRKLIDMVKEGTFREDLYYRISVCVLETKPLRTRSDDIKPLLKCIIMRDTGVIHHEIEDLDTLARLIIQNRDKLTGNIRQLQSIVRNFHLFGRLPKF